MWCRFMLYKKDKIGHFFFSFVKPVDFHGTLNHMVPFEDLTAFVLQLVQV